MLATWLHLKACKKIQENWIYNLFWVYKKLELDLLGVAEKLVKDLIHLQKQKFEKTYYLLPKGWPNTNRLLLGFKGSQGLKFWFNNLWKKLNKKKTWFWHLNKLLSRREYNMKRKTKLPILKQWAKTCQYWQWACCNKQYKPCRFLTIFIFYFL